MSDRKLVRGGTVLTMDPALGDFDRADVLIIDRRIAEIGPGLQVGEAEVIEADGAIVLPGFIDTHRHTWQAPVRLIASDWTLGQYLVGLHVGLSKYFRPQDTYAGNLVGTLEALDSGITTLLDWNHNVDTPEHSDAAIAALRESGARAIFAHSGGARMYQVPSTVPHDRDVLRLQKQYFNSDDQLVTLAFAARGPQYASPEVTLSDWALARELGTRITVHTGDGEWGKNRPVAWMHDHGLTGGTVTYVHCNTLADDEIQIIADTGGTASVAADVEVQMGHGWPSTGRLLAHGIRPSLSIDVCSSNGGDMFGAMRTTIGVQRALDNAAEEHPGEQDRVRLTCRDVLEFATWQGARACGLDAKIGSLTVGKEADLIILKDHGLSLAPLNNPAAAVVYAAHPGMVDTVLVAGTVVKRHGVLVDVDLNRARRLAQETRDYVFAQAAKDASIPDASFDGSWFPATVIAP